MRLIIVIVSIAALLLAVAIGVLGPGTRFGLWDYAAALGWMRDYLALPVMVAAVVAALGFLLALFKARGLAPLALVATIAAAGAAYVPLKMRAMVGANPFIHDITTDFDNPPAIVRGAALPRKNPAAYVGDEPARGSEMTVAQAQREAFPDIQPLTLPVDLKSAIAASRAILEEMNLEILAEGPIGEAGQGWRIEAVATSFWYGFKDDFIVRLTPIRDGVRVDLRSKSRVGLSDLGINAARVRDFLARLENS